MQVILVSAALLVISGFAGLVTWRSPRWSAMVTAAGSVAACVIGLVPVIQLLAGGPDQSWRWQWHMPIGMFSVGMDSLSAFFMVPILVLSALAAVYGRKYMEAYRGQRVLCIPAFFSNLLVASMLMVVVARNGLLFLFAWELMSLSAYFLVTFEHEREAVRRAGWVYLVATHLGAAFLFGLFVLMGRSAGTLDFEGYRQVSRLGVGWSAAFFMLALVGFGAKAGIVPYHVWLPEAHPVAPSHISAIMSGVMIKLGIYGILRVMTFLGEPALWWGPTLMVIGLIGAFVGISLATYQRDLKRALAYSSIENVGLIMLGLGVGVWGWTGGHRMMAVLGLAGGLLHVWNHSIMKGLLFLTAGSVLHGARTKDIERLGGLLKRMPWTGAAMMLGVVAISGLPPLNGFVGEWLIYLGMIRGGLNHDGIGRPILLLSVGLLALIGGLTVACFVRLAGMVLLGAGRSEEAERAHESSHWLTLSMGLLALLCVLVSLLPRLALAATSGVAEQLFGISAVQYMGVIESSESSVGVLALFNLAIWVAIGIAAAGLMWLRRRGIESSELTWGCGYAKPTARMQYTGSSFAEFLGARIFPSFLRTRVKQSVPSGLLPRDGAFASQCPDPLSERVYEPFFAYWAERFARLRWVQQGKVHYYLVYIMVMVVLSFVWISIRTWVRS